MKRQISIQKGPCKSGAISECTHRSALFAVAIAGIVVTCTPLKLFAEPGWSPIRQAVVGHRYEEGLSRCNALIELAKNALQRDRREALTGSNENVSAIEADRLELCSAITAKAQIYAIQGQFLKAEDAINFADSVISSGNPYSKLTRGFILERQGDIAGAQKCYLDDRDSAAFGHLRSVPSESGARLALIAIRIGDTNGAMRYLTRDETPTQQIALGLIALRENDKRAAAGHFARAEALMDDPPKGAPIMPIEYFDNVPQVN
jgi:hypothetical protein